MLGHFPKGAEWRIWDLQVHTPYSTLNNGFGDDLEYYAREFFKKAVEKNVAVVGVADYFVADGYRYLKGLQADVAQLKAIVGDEIFERAKAIKLFANVELRTSVLVDGNRVNYHVIFSDEVSADEIAEDFLAQLHFTSEGIAGGLDQKESLTKRNLERLGQSLKSQHAKFAEYSDLFVGMMQATIDHAQVTEVINRQSSKFSNKHFFCVPCDEDLSKVRWDGQGHLTRKVMIQKSHALVSSNSKTRDFALGLKHESVEEFVAEFGAPKPCIHGSDAHSYEEMFEPDQGRYTWIKADPTFKGLLQILNEPDSRVFIGLCPPSLESIRNRPTKIVKEISVRKKSDSDYEEVWFDSSIPLNSELIAIIGNKGSGKSALADILGLIGNTPRYQTFSFLSADRFRDRKSNRARHFQATALWGDDQEVGPVSLDSLPVDGSVETIKYIPQDYLETICNEVSKGRGSKFYDELQHVIFSHVSTAEQQGFATLDALLDHRSEENNKTIDLLVEQLKSINRALASCEGQLTASHRRHLDALLVSKKRELEAHDLLKPLLQPEPSEDPANNEFTKETAERIQSLQHVIQTVDLEIETAATTIREATQRRVIGERLLGKISNLELQIAAVENDSQQDAKDLELDWGDLVKVEINKKILQDIVGVTSRVIHDIDQKLDIKNPESPRAKKVASEELIAVFAQELSAPQRAYELYKTSVRKWEQDRVELIGSADHPGSLGHIESQIRSLPELQEQEAYLRKQQITKASEIFRAKEALRDDYGKYYGAVQRFLVEHPLARSQQFKLAFNVAITEQKFSTLFLKYINQRKIGSFSGSEDGAEYLKKVLGVTDFDSLPSVVEFLQSLLEALHTDLREGRRGAIVELEEQLATGVTLSDLYDFIFGLSYLEPVYNLRWDNKTLEQLSPGERGNLLLIFYLLIDRDDIPLVIDQPEENLDNNTVFKILVPCVKEAKKRRQIILVTHNPNLAVVCDAEQIICAEMQKENYNKITYASGSIEDEAINQKIVDILEGTRPAFDKRDAKYLGDR
ncbi:TrlF family AAA-like ATPase [Pseudomonas frederiksbergensis]|uniref:TrlF family AAA-like ATPase n=1 Tax=Pseudomonas frederiksbergensis TaxID=104087 RepID=UPI003D1DA48D